MKRKTLVVLCGAAALSLWFSGRVKAFNPQSDPPAFGLVGVDPFETARLNAVCADTPLPGGVAPGPCRVTLAFRDVSGRVLQQMTQSLQPGEGTSLDLTVGGASARVGGRMEVQPFISPMGTGFVLASVDLFDSNTGRTAAIVNPTEPRSLGLTGPAGQ